MTLSAILSQQPRHPVYPAVTEAEARALPPAVVLQLLEGRARQIALEDPESGDPYRHGWEPGVWDLLDWEIARLRCELPGTVLEVLLLGGNRASKTDYCAKRIMQMIAGERRKIAGLLHLDETASRAVQQSRIYRYLPAEFKTDSGKLKKDRTAKLSYNQITGFTDNAFSLPNASGCYFKFYGPAAEKSSVEGFEFDAAWSDEMVPEDWIETMYYRLLTRAQKADGEILLKLQAALRRKEADPALKFPRELLPALLQGVHLISFTPLQGFTAAVARFLRKAVTIRTEPSDLLTITDGDGQTVPRPIPRVRRCSAPHRLVVNFYSSDNPHGVNWPKMREALRNEPERRILERAYGEPTQAHDVRFPLFSRASHVRPMSMLPAEGTWYHIVDPCPGRNYCMLWAIVPPQLQAFAAREWPQQNQYIPGIGMPGEWTLQSTGRRKDGDRGPAQKPFGFGIGTYKREIARIERELFRLQWAAMSPAQQRAWRDRHGFEKDARIRPYIRIIDSRGGAAPSLSYDSPVTLIEMFEQWTPNEQGLVDHADKDLGPLLFTPSSRSLTGEGGSTEINDGVELVNNLLEYDPTRATPGEGGRMVFHGRAPQLYIGEDLECTITAMEMWTGADGQKGACKDKVDLIRYLSQHGLEYVPEVRRSTGGYF